jgi:hypothetical protein
VTKSAAVATHPLRAKKAIGATAAAWKATLLLVAFSSSASLYLPLAALRLRRPRLLFFSARSLNKELRYTKPYGLLILRHLCSFCFRKNRLAVFIKTDI